MYRCDDDYIYRVDRDGGLIDGAVPYAQPATITITRSGCSYPLDYNYLQRARPVSVLSMPDNGDYLYRYGDGAIYQVDPVERR